jgi:hypothetical protein
MNYITDIYTHKTSYLLRESYLYKQDYTNQSSQYMHTVACISLEATSVIHVIFMFLHLGGQSRETAVKL